MTPLPALPPAELRARLLARVDDIRRTLDQTADALSDDQRREYRRLIAALESLERRIREILAE
jgi:hypothetical protein